MLYELVNYIPERVITIDAQQPLHLNNNIDSTLMLRLIKHNSQRNHKRELKLKKHTNEQQQQQPEKKGTHTHQHSIFQYSQTTMTSRSIEEKNG